MKYRICYEKTGRLIYVSHLDMQRLLQRMLRRSGVSMMFSQGFNPHVLMSFTPPLPLFASSLAEYVDVELSGGKTPNEVLHELGEVCPEGLRVRGVDCPGEGAPPLSKTFSRASYRMEIKTEAKAADVAGFYENSGEIVIEKRNKKKQLKKEDIKPRIYSFDVTDIPGGIVIDCTLCFLNEGLLNPFVLAGALERSCPALAGSKVLSVCKMKVE